MSFHKIPYYTKAYIAGYADDPLHPSSQRVALSQKKKKGKDQDLDEIMSRLHDEKHKKGEFVRQINETDVTDLLLWKKLVEKVKHAMIQDENQPPVGIKRTPNYYKYIDGNTLQYLYSHPYSKKVHVSGWRNDILFFFTFHLHGIPKVSVIHISLPNPIPPDFDLLNDDHLKQYVFHSPNAIVSDYALEI